MDNIETSSFGRASRSLAFPPRWRRAYPHCAGVQAVSTYCVGDDAVSPLLNMSGNRLLVSAMTWGAIIIELVIAAVLIDPERWRKLTFRLEPPDRITA
ncbi:hypothetical protein AB0N81_10370 [Streptomyces sp. NPDC093510]|uniref:hypothetical protein n=1 Tax=Streptomyces sp. NPDC093510 TaxID=3155199 RepID=UPI00342EE8D0